MKHSEIRILVIDDEPLIRDSLVGFLEDYEFAVSSVESAEEALENLQVGLFDLAIVDLRLPGMSGEELIKKAFVIAPEIKYVIHTGSVNYRLSDELLEIGIKPEHVFLKPQTDLSIFIDTIQLLLK
jgi:DNA-binding NtrC family response regulator